MELKTPTPELEAAQYQDLVKGHKRIIQQIFAKYAPFNTLERAEFEKRLDQELSVSEAAKKQIKHLLDMSICFDFVGERKIGKDMLQFLVWIQPHSGPGHLDIYCLTASEMREWFARADALGALANTSVRFSDRQLRDIWARVRLVSDPPEYIKMITSKKRKIEELKEERPTKRARTEL